VRNDNLVAYIVTDKTQNLTVEELKAFVGSKLPQFMVPHAFVQLNKLPLTFNGKIDQSKLPNPTLGDFSSLSEFVEVESPEGKEVASMWAELLHADQKISAAASFFEVGGNSFLATQLISRMNKRFSFDITFQEFWASPTIAAVVQHLSKTTRIECGG